MTGILARKSAFARNFLGASALLFLAALSGCADDPPALGTTAEAPLTLENGHEFLVSIDGDRVVLEREVGTHPLPFTDQEFVGKNIVIHPTSGGSGDDGLFARVLRVEDAGKRVALVVRPLELTELANARRDGDDTLTIYENHDLRELPAELPRAGASPSASPAHGLAVAWPPTLSSMGSLTTIVSGGASTKFRDVDFGFEPGLSGKWIDGRGLQLGARLALSTKMKVDIDALVLVGKPVIERVGERDLLALTSTGPVTLIEAPVLIGGVYTTIGVRASFGCYARVEQHFKGTLDIDLAAKIEGSAIFEISPSSTAKSWITEGDVPFSATGHADVSLDTGDDITKPSIYCEVPRLTVYVQPGGKVLEAIGGPQVYLSSIGKFYASWDDAPAFRIGVAGGVTARPLGKQLTAEATLLTWTP